MEKLRIIVIATVAVMLAACGQNMTANIGSDTADTAQVDTAVEVDTADPVVTEPNYKDFKMPPRQIKCNSCYSYKLTEYNVSVNEKYESCKKTFVFDYSKKQIIIINQISGNIIRHKYLNEKTANSEQGGLFIIYTLKNGSEITLSEDYIRVINDNYVYIYNYDKNTPPYSTPR